ncbi:MAG TPA: DUF1186 domain-containing protein [Caulobacteraceae bacterium]|nr:DUF1186 domain-containing protein [Caulobacteraceae bacterium]
MPDFAVAVCTAQIDQAAPALRAVVSRAADGVALSDDEARLLFRGLHVLGAARDGEACQAVLRLLHLPSDALDALIGDSVTETLPRILAGVFDDNADALFTLIADRSVDEYVRDAAFGAATFLTWEGRIGRDVMQRFLERFHHERLAGDDDYAWIGWLEAVAMLGLRPLTPLVDTVWREGRLPSMVMERRHFDEDLAEVERAPADLGRFKRANLGYIDDVLASLDWCRAWEREADEDGQDGVWDDLAPEPIEPVVNPWRHVGRNDPCPCGSGRKAKKCCLTA